MKKPPEWAVEREVVITPMVGSKAYYESIVIPGVQKIQAKGGRGQVHIALFVENGEDAQRAAAMYRERCADAIMWVPEFTISVEVSGVEPDDA